MKVTFLGHSGFLVEWQDIYCLFDYDTGALPKFHPSKTLYVFVSHSHGDHYNRDIWKLRKQDMQEGAEVFFILSKDVPLSAGSMVRLGLKEEDHKNIVKVRAEQDYQLPGGIKIQTLRSTDKGVAFLVQYADQTVFHAGDLNLWTWKEESRKNNEEMKKRFLAEMEKLKGAAIDIAFFPLDPRQEEDCGKGLEIFNQMVHAKTVFPMHFWKQYAVIPRYIDAHPAACGNIAIIRHAGQEFELSP